MAPDILVKLAENTAEVEGAMALRRRVFVEEQGVPADQEYDEYDETAIHIVALADGEVVGTGRLLYEAAGQGRIGRMAVDAPWRRKGVGGRILEALEAEAQLRGMARVLLHAQTYVQQFYARHAYKPEGTVFEEAGIEHVAMWKQLN